MVLSLMRCLHPHCPMGEGLPSWEDLVDVPELKIQPRYRKDILDVLKGIGRLDGRRYPGPKKLSAPLKRIFSLCPCLYAQIGVKVTPAAVVHLCEVTLGTLIKSHNVGSAFDIQHPSMTNYRDRHSKESGYRGWRRLMRAI